MGTYGYTPMEQFGGRAVPASALYALGAALIHLLTGTAPNNLPQRDLQMQFTNKVGSSHSLVYRLQQLIEPAWERRFSTARTALLALESGISVLQLAISTINSGQGGLFVFVPVPEGIKGWREHFYYLLYVLYLVALGLIF